MKSARKNIIYSDSLWWHTNTILEAFLPLFLKNEYIASTQPSMSRKERKNDNDLWYDGIFLHSKSEIALMVMRIYPFLSMEQFEQAIVDRLDLDNNELQSVKLHDLVLYNTELTRLN